MRTQTPRSSPPSCSCWAWERERRPWTPDQAVDEAAGSQETGEL